MVQRSGIDIFRQVDVTFQQTQVSHTGTNYPYKAYIDTILKTNLSTQENLLTSQLFYKDKGPDTNDAKTGSNRGLFERAVATIGGKIVDLEGHLFLDLFEQSRLLVNSVSISNGWHYGTNFFKPEKNLEFFRLKICAIDAYPGKLE